ncbi:hypothetical protein BA171_01850 [Candidatus Hamiltonella defensa (Bemisia tabaci)]|uniref:Uncharacterized protein n=1 Tax=Candidatus Hamiltonella defensa (Bemisia tabaci) TaxID=672795 RepID=A0A249DXV6_9ENTR|nr:hypothetical protein BA171_01850 [Candidatus Hamiltonella defensa (Bemisia tabaci)]
MGCGGVASRKSPLSQNPFLDAQPLMAIRIELPFPPSVNHYWVRTVRRVHLSEAAKWFSRLTAAAVAEFLKWRYTRSRAKKSHYGD